MKKSKWIGLTALSLCLTNTVCLAVNCNCCCKVLDAYGIDLPDDPRIRCWSFERGTIMEGVVVDSGVCIQVSKDTGRTGMGWEWYGCDLLCVGRNPAGFAHPNPLQEASGTKPATAVMLGMYPEENCGEPGPEEKPPGNGCG